MPARPPPPDFKGLKQKKRLQNSIDLLHPECSKVTFLTPGDNGGFLDLYFLNATQSRMTNEQCQRVQQRTASTTA